MRRGTAAAVAAAVASTVLSACGSPPSPADAVRTWASTGSFAQSVETLLSDSTAMAHEIAHHRAATNVRTICAELFDDTNGANTDELPSPDDRLSSLLGSAYDRLVQAASRCTQAPGDPAVLARADAERHLAVGMLVAAVLREEAVAGRSLRIPGIP